MDILSKTLKEIDLFCNQNSIPYVVIGGIAAIEYGLNRTTQDIDVNLLIEQSDIKKTGQKIIEKFQPRISNAENFFEKNFVLPVIFQETKLKIDFIAGLTGFDKKAKERCKQIAFGNSNISICSLEDLIIYKLFAARSVDLSDLADIFKIHGNDVDTKYLKETANEFAKLDRSDIMENLKEFL